MLTEKARFKIYNIKCLFLGGYGSFQFFSFCKGKGKERKGALGISFLLFVFDQWINFNGGVSHNEQILPQVRMIWYSCWEFFFSL